MQSNTAEKTAAPRAPTAGSLGPKKATWAYIIPTYREPTPEQRAAGATCDDQITVEIAPGQLDGYFQAQGRRGVSEQIQGVLSRQLGDVRQELVEAVRAASPAAPKEDAAAAPRLDPDAEAGVRALAAIGRSMREAGAGEQPVQPPSPRSRHMRPVAYAKYRDVSKSTVKRWIKLGLPHQKLGRSLISIDIEAADDWLKNGGPDLAIKRAAVLKARTRRGP